jgi:hypothetical protein
MKTTISALFIPLIGALIVVTSAACNGLPTAPGPRNDVPGCSIGDSVIVSSHGTHCPQ